MPICLFGNTRDTSVIYEKAKFIYFIYMQPRKMKFDICSNKHETGLAYSKNQLKNIKILLTLLHLRQSIFVFDRTTNGQFSKMRNEIYGSLVTIQYHAKCNNHHESSQAIQFAFMFVAANLNWSLLFFNSDNKKVYTSIYQ